MFANFAKIGRAAGGFQFGKISKYLEYYILIPNCTSNIVCYYIYQPALVYNSECKHHTLLLPDF